MAFLPRWPKQDGQQPLQDTLAWWAFVLLREGLSKRQVAKALGYPLDTMRRYHIFGRDGKAETIWQEQVEDPVGAYWRYPDGELRPPRYLPFVYRPIGEEQPPFSAVNLPLGLIENSRGDAALAIEARGWRALRELRAGRVCAAP